MITIIDLGPEHRSVRPFPDPVGRATMERHRGSLARGPVDADPVGLAPDFAPTSISPSPPTSPRHGTACTRWPTDRPAAPVRSPAPPLGSWRRDRRRHPVPMSFAMSTIVVSWERSPVSRGLARTTSFSKPISAASMHVLDDEQSKSFGRNGGPETPPSGAPKVGRGPPSAFASTLPATDDRLGNPDQLRRSAVAHSAHKRQTRP